jgi:hypothetical protein
MTSLRDDPRWVDWGDREGAVTCPVCGRKGLQFNGSLSGVSKRYPEATTVVHGGVPYTHDPYDWFFGERPRSKWEGMLVIREQHDFEPQVLS